jgi:hypothetical protein
LQKDEGKTQIHINHSIKRIKRERESRTFYWINEHAEVDLLGKKKKKKN